jgi:hypothetical protein
LNKKWPPAIWRPVAAALRESRGQSQLRGDRICQ